MGIELVYWLMVLDCAISAGWLSMSIHHLMTRNYPILVSNLLLATFFMNNAYWAYEGYIAKHTSEDMAVLLGRVFGALLALIATAIMSVTTNHESTKPKVILRPPFTLIIQTDETEKTSVMVDGRIYHTTDSPKLQD